MQLGAQLALFFCQRIGAERWRGDARRAVVNLAVFVRLQRDGTRRDVRLQPRTVVNVGVAQTNFLAHRAFGQFPILVLRRIRILLPRFVAVHALEAIDDILFKRIIRIGAVSDIGVILPVVGGSAREILVVRLADVARCIAIKRVVQLDGRFALNAEVDAQTELVVERLLRLCRLPSVLAADHGACIAIVHLLEGCALLPRLLERARQGLDRARAVDGVVVVVEIVVRDVAPLQQTLEGVLDAHKLDVTRLRLAVDIVGGALDMRIRRESVCAAVAVAAMDAIDEARGARIVRIAEIEGGTVRLRDAVEGQRTPLLRRKLRLAVVVPVDSRRMERQTLLPDVSLAMEGMPRRIAARIEDSLRGVRGSKLPAVRIDDAVLERIVPVRGRIRELHLIVNVLGSSRVLRPAIHRLVAVAARSIEIELLAIGKAAVRIACDLAVRAVERKDLLPVNVRVFMLDEVAIRLPRIVAVLDIRRAVVEFLHEVERHAHIPARDLAAAGLRDRAVRVRHLITAVVLAEVVDAVFIRLPVLQA